MMNTAETDYLVIGGGVVGMAIAYGLCRAGESVRVLDEGDDAFRASRGNFGLVWVQGKGADKLDYARWTMGAARHWPTLAEQLQQEAGIDVQLSQIGGLYMCLSDDELAARVHGMASLQKALGGHYPYEVLNHNDVNALSPGIGPDVVGAVFCPMDGHVSPLRLLRALVQAYVQRGGVLTPCAQAQGVSHRNGQFHVRTQGSEYVARRVVLAAGLGNRTLAPFVGLNAPVEPCRGQILVSDRVQPFLRHPTLHVRQTGEGVVQIGDSKEDVGFDDGTTIEQLSHIAQRAVRCFPILSNVNVVRTWGALRVMTPDGYPLYQASSECEGAFVVTCHSGITLASAHAGVLVDWLRGGGEPLDIAAFKEERFHV